MAKTFEINLRKLGLSENYFGKDGALEYWQHPIDIGLKIQLNGKNIIDSEAFIKFHKYGYPEGHLHTFSRTLTTQFHKAFIDLIKGKEITSVQIEDHPYSLSIRKKSEDIIEIKTNHGLSSDYSTGYLEIQEDVIINDFFSEIVKTYEDFINQSESCINRYRDIWEATSREYDKDPQFENQINYLKEALADLKSELRKYESGTP